MAMTAVVGFVDRRRQRLDGNVDDDAKREGSVLFDGALAAKGDLTA